MKVCPFCCETINDHAVKCRYCSSSLLPGQPESETTLNRTTRSSEVTYVVDQGLVRFGKFAIAVLAIFVTIGAALYGFKVNEAEDRVQAASDKVRGVYDQVEHVKDTVIKDQSDYENQLTSARRELAEKRKEINTEAEQAKQTVQALVDEDKRIARERQDFEVFFARIRQTGPATTGAPQIEIYDAKRTQSLPGAVVANPNESRDVQASEAFKGLLATYVFYQEVFKRNSIDDHGLPLVGTVHYGNNYDNAFWNGQQMVFGDGDGKIFRRFTISIDLIGHELTYGVIANTAKLDFQGQPGALNVSIADVFGSIIKQYSANPKQTAAGADWLIGAGTLMPGIKGVALRSMRNPGSAYNDPTLGKDPQAGTMAGYVETADDAGGVHINSGIPNRAFYLAATKLGGYSWDKAGPIWYAALRDPALWPTSKFADFANITVTNAARLFGANVAKTVRDAWKQVGVL